MPTYTFCIETQVSFNNPVTIYPVIPLYVCVCSISKMPFEHLL